MGVLLRVGLLSGTLGERNATTIVFSGPLGKENSCICEELI